MISAVAVSVILALLLVLLVKARFTVAAAAVAIILGMVIAVTPLGDPLRAALNASGGWIWAAITS